MTNKLGFHKLDIFILCLTVVGCVKAARLLFNMKRKSIQLSVLLSFLINSLKAETVHVIEFQPESKPAPVEYPLGPLATNVLTLCLRYKARYNRRQSLLHTRQFGFNTYGSSDGKAMASFPIYPLNKSSPFPENFFPIFSISEVPGIWSSICLSITLLQYNLELRVFQNGSVCWEKLYRDSTGVEFDPIYYKQSMDFKEM